MIVRNVESPEVQRTTYVAHGGGMARMLLTRQFMQAFEFFAWGLLPAGRILEEHVDPVEEIYFILGGAGRMKVGDEEREVKTWDAVWIPAGECHSLTNTGEENMFTVVVAAVPRRARTSRSRQRTSGAG
jgi:mannose-6-phosphate isomerase-like protein (cupin superfamily)